MNANDTSGVNVLRRDEGRASREQVTLHAQHPVPAAQPHELDTFASGHPGFLPASTK